MSPLGGGVMGRLAGTLKGGLMGSLTGTPKGRVSGTVLGTVANALARVLRGPPLAKGVGGRSSCETLLGNIVIAHGLTGRR